MKTKLLLSSIAATLILAGCGGGTTNSANSVVNNTPKETRTVAGKVIDGYIKNADVCLDLNNNDQIDPNEPQAKSDENGSYKLVGNFDLNDSLTIIAKNGIDIDTNKSFDGELKTLVTQPNLTPATTLVKALMDKNMTKDEAMSQVAKIMKISKADIAKDPIEKMEKENNDSLYKANLSVHKTMELIAKSDDKNVTSVYKDFADTVHKLKKENQKVDDMDDVIDNVKDINETIKEKAKDLHTQIQEMKIDKHNRADFAKEIEDRIPHTKDGNDSKFNEHINMPKFGDSKKDENKTFMNAEHNKYMNELNNSMDGNKSQNPLDDSKDMQKIKSKNEDKNSSKDLKNKQNFAISHDSNKSFVNKDFNKNNNHTYKENNITKSNTDKLSQTDKKDMMDDSKNKGMMNSEFNSQTQANSNSSMDAKKEANTTKYTKDNDEHSNYKSSKPKKISVKDSNKMDVNKDGAKENKDLSANSDKNRTNANNMQSNNNESNLTQATEDRNSSKNNQTETKPAFSKEQNL